MQVTRLPRNCFQAPAAAPASALALALLLTTGCFTPRASLPVFSAGPLTNLSCSGDRNSNACDRPATNAMAHAGWALAIPGLGHAVGGRKGLRWAGAAWIGYSLINEALFHAPPGQLGPEYAAEVRTDLLSRIVPTLVLLGVDWLVERATE